VKEELLFSEEEEQAVAQPRRSKRLRHVKDLNEDDGLGSSGDDDDYKFFLGKEDEEIEADSQPMEFLENLCKSKPSKQKQEKKRDAKSKKKGKKVEKMMGGTKVSF